MDMSKKIEDFIIYAVIIAVFLAIPIGFVLGWFGHKDIFSCEKAEEAAQTYLSENHPDSDYEISSSGYVDKDERYYVRIISPSSQDSSFRLEYDREGKLVYNSYEGMVTKRANVAFRLSDEYDSAVEAALEPAAPWDDFSVVGDLYFRTSDAPIDEPYYLITDGLVLVGY